MPKILLLSSIVMVIAGISMSVYGISEEHVKPFGIGMVLIFGSGVFATLFLGTRRRIRR